MKKIIPFIVLLCIFVHACDKMPENGVLDGQWQLMEKIEKGDTTNVKEQHLYCAFQLDVCMFGSKSLGVRNYFCYFEHKDSTMRFHTFTNRSQYTEGNNVDKLITADEKELIQPWGFYSTDCTFKVKELTGSHMVLNHEKTYLIYRKL